jgi:hypothetical protein
MRPVAAFFWRRLESAGYDSCRLLQGDDCWRIVGAAVFIHARRPCHLHYEVITERNWVTRCALIGYFGNKEVELLVDATQPGWATRGRSARGGRAPALDDCIDLDLGFTPATNLVAIRRLSLAVGESAFAPAAYLSFPGFHLRRLPQTYQRLRPTAYRYIAPSFGYDDTLEVARDGGVVRYPGLFKREAFAGT